MKKTVLKLFVFAIVFSSIVFANFVNIQAQTDPLGLCPDGKAACAMSKDGKKVWHKGNADTIEIFEGYFLNKVIK